MDGLSQDTALLRDLVKYSGVTATEVAKKARVAPSTINRPYNGSATTRLSLKTIEKLQSAFPKFPGWSRLGEHQHEYRHLGSDTDLAQRVLGDGEDMVEVAEIDLRFGLGAAIMDEEITEQQVQMRSFPRAWLRYVTTSPASQLYWAKGQGDSMEPKISEGDIILIDRSQTSAAFGDLYWAIAYGQTGMVKRLRPMPDGSVKILSDNPAVPPEIAYDGELTIFGRVVAVVKRI